MAIIFEKVSHTYGENSPFSFVAIKDIDLKIEKGKFAAIIGHTGSGKSTLIQHINALLKPTSGKVIIDDYIIDANKKAKQLKKLRKKAGLVFQFPEYQLFEETIEKDIMFGPMNFGVNENDAKILAKKMIKAVGLDESYLNKSPFDISGGQKRRVAIAGILAMEPDILVLDEPTAGLDPQGSIEIMDLFKKINQGGTTIIVVTHDMDLVYKYCEEVVVLNKGKVVSHKNVDQTFEDIDSLINLSINLPQITELIKKLNDKGFNIDTKIKDIDQLTKAIKKELKG